MSRTKNTTVEEMKNFRIIEFISSKLFVVFATIILFIVPTTFYFLTKLDFSDLDSLATFIDAVFKTIAILIGALWTLNRYYANRTDAPQIRIDADINCIPSSRFQGISTNRSLLLYRLDIVNTGKTLIEPFNHFIEVQAVTPSNDAVDYLTLGRWPSEGMHPSGSIEPGSWSAINDTLSIPASVQAVRIFVGIDLGRDGIWTWHKTFDTLSNKN